MTRPTSGLAFQLRMICWTALLVMTPVVFYFTTEGTWDLTRQHGEGGWSAGFFMSQARSMLAHGRLDVDASDLHSECFERDSRCYGYFGVTPSVLRIPFLGILQSFHSAFTPLFLGIAILVAYGAALQMLQRSLREGTAAAPPRALVIGYAMAGALALGPGGALLFLTRPAVFEEAIAWSVGFFLLALNHVWAWHARDARSLLPAVLFGIAAANARPTAATACGVLGLVAAVLWCRNRSSRRVLAAALCLSLLPGLTAAGVFWLKLGTPIPNMLLNKEVQETTFWRTLLERNGGRMAGLMFAPTALVAYLRPDAVSPRREWPFFDFRFPQEPVLWLPPLPADGAYVERVASVTATMPLPWIVTLVVVIWLGAEARRMARYRPGASSSRAPALDSEQWVLAAGLLLSAAAMVALTVTIVGITNRYLADFFAISAVGIALGHRVILPFLAQRPLVAAIAGLVALLLVAWSIVVALSLATQLVFVVEPAWAG
jgi:hypothetical protein